MLALADAHPKKSLEQQIVMEMIDLYNQDLVDAKKIPEESKL